MDDDALLFDWLRYYFALIALATILGLAVGLVSLGVVPTMYEGWTLVAREGRSEVSDRELGLTAQGVFRSEEVHTAGMLAAGEGGDPETFLDHHAELRAIPDTNTLVIIGKATNRRTARAISVAMAAALVRVFDQRALSQMTVIGEAAARPEQLSRPVTVAIWTTSGIWTGLVVAIAHFRLRRPVMSLSRAMRLCGPSRVVRARRGGPRWLGVLRRRPRFNRRTSAASIAAAAPEGRVPVVVSAGLSERQEDRLALVLERLSPPTETDGAVVPLLVAHSGTPEVRLLVAREEVASVATLGEASGPHLVWFG